jgi:Cu-Zn family superoxide dismutase
LTADLFDAQGRSVGTATLVQEAGQVRVAVSASGLTPGEHGIHVHARGVCTPPDFASALGHFNPAGRRHGLSNPEGPHAGDLPNLVAAADGSARYETTSTHLALGSGAGQLEADSAAVVIHAVRDDMVSDPAGNAGARVACGVLRRTLRRAAP